MDARAWQSSQSSEAELLAAAAERGSPRQLRLFSCACARWLAPAVKGFDAIGMVELAERIADRRPDEPSPPGW